MVMDNVSPLLFGAVFLALICITVCCCSCHREVRMNHCDARNNPVKLILGIVQFAKKNKGHIFHCALTYNEMPSRLDLAKQTYGRPFTTREVEDVRTFWQPFLLVISLMGFQLRDDTTSLSLTVSKSLPDDYDYIGLIYPSWGVTSLASVICIIVHQLVICPFFPKFIPRMLTRMKVDLVNALLSLTAIPLL